MDKGAPGGTGCSLERPKNKMKQRGEDASSVGRYVGCKEHPAAREEGAQTACSTSLLSGPEAGMASSTFCLRDAKKGFLPLKR